MRRGSSPGSSSGGSDSERVWEGQLQQRRRGRRFSVSSESFDEFAAGHRRPSTAPAAVAPVEARARVRATLEKNSLMRPHRASFDKLIGRLQERRVSAGDVVIRAGERFANELFLIDSGEFAVTNPRGKLLAALGEGRYFGELALLYDTPRTATVTCTRDGTLFVMSRETFRTTIMEDSIERRQRLSGFLSGIQLLSGLDEYERNTLADALETLTFPAGSTILTEGEQGDRFFIVECGSVHVTKKGASVADLTAGDHFGEVALLETRPRTATVTAITDVKLLSLNRQDFSSLLGPAESRLRQTAADRS